MPAVCAYPDNVACARTYVSIIEEFLPSNSGTYGSIIVFPDECAVYSKRRLACGSARSALVAEIIIDGLPDVPDILNQKVGPNKSRSGCRSGKGRCSCSSSAAGCCRRIHIKYPVTLRSPSGSIGRKRINIMHSIGAVNRPAIPSPGNLHYSLTVVGIRGMGIIQSPGNLHRFTAYIRPDRAIEKDAWIMVRQLVFQGNGLGA